jgi:hypothetical protein
MPGRYTLAPGSGIPAGFSLQSANVGASDLLDMPLVVDSGDQIPPAVVTLSTQRTELGGTVQDASGQPAAALTVIAYAMEERFWTPLSRRIQAVRPSSNGRYAFRGLPPGPYRVVAVEDPEPGQWFDPAFLRGLGGFLTVTVTANGRQTLDLRAK